MKGERVAVIGAGMGGLAAALTLAARGWTVTVLEKANQPGGKMHAVPAGPTLVDGGPTVFTMRWVLDELLAEAGFATDEHMRLTPLGVLARHVWDGSEGVLDLAANEHATAEAIAHFAGAAEARGFRAFSARAAAIHATLDRTFMRAPRPNPVTLVGRAGLSGLTRLWGVSPFAVLWEELCKYFRDARLRQLFGRYATYCGANPFTAPATLMLIAHVEQRGVWAVEGGMHALARTLAALAECAGATFRFGAEVAEILVDGGRVAGVRLADGERIAADHVVVNADVAALSAGQFGEAVRQAVPDQKRVPRSLSALTWTGLARASGFPLTRHTVFFSRDYRDEFDRIAHGQLPREPTVYICAQDRGDDGTPPGGPERLLVLVNAPARGDRGQPTPEEIERCEQATFALLARCGLQISWEPGAMRRTGPAEWARMFPATGGALYGRDLAGWRASFQRPGAKTRIPGLYLAGGSVHPGPGVPMTLMSGRLAALALMADHASTQRFHKAATLGGMSMRSAMTEPMR